MKKIVLTLVAFCIFVSTAVQTLAQAGPPPVLQIVREDIKPGMMEPHSKEANANVRIWAKANSSRHRLALVPVAGNENEVTYLWPFASFTDYEKGQRDLDKIGETYKADFDRIRHSGEDYHSAQRDMLARLRPDLSYNIPITDMAKMRYMRFETIRVRPGHVPEFEEARKIINAAHVKAKVDEQMAVYQVVGGAQAGTFIVIIPWGSMDDSNLLPHGKAYLDALGDKNQEKLAKMANDYVAFNDVTIYAFAPQLSYMPKEFVAADPGFWTLKSLGSPAPAKKKFVANAVEKKQ